MSILLFHKKNNRRRGYVSGVVAASLVFCILSGCGLFSGNTDARIVSETRVRVRNTSGIDFDRVVVGFPNQRENYGAVAAGQASEYRDVTLAYAYAYVEVHIGEKTYEIQPIDYVGETPLAEGHFTYALTLEEDRLSLRLLGKGRVWVAQVFSGGRQCASGISYKPPDIEHLLKEAGIAVFGTAVMLMGTCLACGCPAYAATHYALIRSEQVGEAGALGFEPSDPPVQRGGRSHV